MYLRFNGLLLAAALLLSAALPSKLIAEGVSDALIAELNHWIDTQTDLPRNPAPVTVQIVPEPVLREGDEAMMIGARVAGLYDPDTATILLAQPWSAANPQDVSVLLHELIHHRQQMVHHYCQAAMELPAYKAQDAWLQERGLKADVFWVGVVLTSSCAKRDIHP